MVINTIINIHGGTMMIVNGGEKQVATQTFVNGRLVSQQITGMDPCGNPVIITNGQPFSNASNQANEPVSVREFNVESDWSSLEVNSNIKVNVTHGESERVTVMAAREILNAIHFDVIDETLEIGVEDDLESFHPVEVFIQHAGAPLNRLVAQDHAEVTLQGTFPIRQMTARDYSKISWKDAGQVSERLVVSTSHYGEVCCSGLKGSVLSASSSTCSSIELKRLAFEHVSFSTGEASSIKVDGVATYGNFSSDGASAIHAERLKVKFGDARAHGASSIRCHVADLTKSVGPVSQVFNYR